MNKIKLIDYDIFDNKDVKLVFNGMENYYKDKIIGEFIISELTNGKYENPKLENLSFNYRGENKIRVYNYGDSECWDFQHKIIYMYDKKTYVKIPSELTSSIIPKLRSLINKINNNDDIIKLINDNFNMGE